MTQLELRRHARELAATREERDNIRQDLDHVREELKLARQQLAQLCRPPAARGRARR
jgi:uncharacterized protein (DUF3084 family)